MISDSWGSALPDFRSGRTARPCSRRSSRPSFPHDRGVAASPRLVACAEPPIVDSDEDLPAANAPKDRSSPEDKGDKDRDLRSRCRARTSAPMRAPRARSVALRRRAAAPRSARGSNGCTAWTQGADCAAGSSCDATKNDSLVRRRLHQRRGLEARPTWARRTARRRGPHAHRVHEGRCVLPLGVGAVVLAGRGVSRGQVRVDVYERLHAERGPLRERPRHASPA